MKPSTTDEVSYLLRGYVPAAALGAALELGVFWRLAEKPQDAASLAEILDIPPHRCKYWLEYLREMGLLELGQEGYMPSATGRVTILEARSQKTWALLAEEARERYPVVQDLAIHIREPGSIWAAQGLTAPDYVAKMADDPERAQRFTRMLYELHQAEAEELAETLDMSGVKRLMDVGGGSGVMALALLRRYPDLSAVVIDQETVCAAGEVIAAENGLEGRISYQPANFLVDELPSGFDLILECDVGIYNERLFRKFEAGLNPGGKVVILDYQFETEAVDSLVLAGRAFLSSLANPDFAFETVEEIQAMLRRVGFESFSEARPISDGLYFECWK